ncbi:MAG: HK97-gp10 family putative phage morphogenesis protein [Candidatus Puniceispirillales bacterium]
MIVKKEAGEVKVQSNADYSKYLEYGTSKMLARPFLFPASEKSTAKIIQATFNKVVEVIKGLAK